MTSVSAPPMPLVAEIGRAPALSSRGSGATAIAAPLTQRSSRGQRQAQEDQRDHGEEEKQDFRDPGGGDGDAVEAEKRGNERDDQKYQCPTEHDDPSRR